jgi:hypothetical protein
MAKQYHYLVSLTIKLTAFCMHVMLYLLPHMGGRVFADSLKRHSIYRAMRFFYAFSFLYVGLNGDTFGCASAFAGLQTPFSPAPKVLQLWVGLITRYKGAKS